LPRPPPRAKSARRPRIKLNPVFSPDGRQLAYMDKDGVGSDGDRAAVRVRDLASGTVREIGASIDRWPNAIAWAADGRTIYARSDDDGRERLYAYRLSGKVERLPVDGVSAIDVSRRGLMLVTSSFSSPPQVYAADAAGRSLHRVSDVGAGQIAGLAMARTHSLTFSGWNGEPVQAFVTEPLNPSPAAAIRAVRDPWRATRRLSGRMELRPQSAGLGGARLCHGHGQFPWLDRVRQGLRAGGAGASRRSRAGRPAKGMGRRARRLPVS
jgi:sugar lactone lactonase YvrE